MKVPFNSAFRWLWLVLLLIALGSLWAIAQTNTNKLGTASKQPSGVIKRAELLSGDYLTFGLDRLEPLNHHYFLGQPLWKYPASLIYILLAFYVSKLIDFVARVWLKRLAQRTQTKLDDLLLQLLEGPIKVVVFVLFPLMIWTGLAMSPAITSVFPALVSVLGSQQSARSIHFFAADFLVLFLLVHVGMVCLAGFKHRVRTMITGHSAAGREHA